MRDPKRIPPFLSLLKEIWQEQPDTRFFQFVSNFEAWMLLKHKKSDLYFVEDDQMMKFLHEYDEERTAQMKRFYGDKKES